MHHRTSLPRRLGERFSVRAAEETGVLPGRHSARDLARPFHGVRSATPIVTFFDAVQAYSVRLRPGQSFGGVTAARLWGLPWPDLWRSDEPVVVVVGTGRTPPKTAGVVGRRLRSGRAKTARLRGLPVIDPVAALFMCAADVSVVQAVVLMDALVTTARNYPGRVAGRRPLTTLAEIRERLHEWGRFPGRGVIVDALDHVRERVESPKETETRLLIVNAGLPEPGVQHEARVQARFIARVDLAYPELKIAIEYDGDGHRTDKDQWRRDIARRRALEDAGWVFIQVTQDDLRGPNRDALVARIRRAIASRTV